MEKSANTFSAVRLAPAPALAPFVDYVRVLSNVPANEPYVRLPDGCLELVLRSSSAGVSLNVMGTRLHPLQKEGERIPEALTVRFKAGAAYPFFGVPISELTDRIVPLQLLWGASSAGAGLERASALAHGSAQEQTAAMRLAALQGALAARLAQPLFEPASVPMVRRAIRALARSPQLPHAAALAAQLDTSPRQLRRAFADVVGVTPKAYLRILRFQRAYRAARRSPEQSWSSLARAHGYYDQAHMIAEFRTLAGRTPAALRAATQKATQNR